MKNTIIVASTLAALTIGSCTQAAPQVTQPATEALEDGTGQVTAEVGLETARAATTAVSTEGSFEEGAAATVRKGSLVETEITRQGSGYRFERNGWIYVHIEGEPEERGYQHGYLLAPELAEIIGNFEELTYQNTGMEWEFFADEAVEQFAESIRPEFLDEIKGIAKGAQAAGAEISWQDVLTWNGYEELLGYWWPNEMAGKYAQPDNEHCSAFIATGSVTRDGGIVMAHNSWDAFEHGQYVNVVLDIDPDTGHRMFMQSAPGFIASFTDFFVTDAGIMGTETTIGGYSDYDPDETAEFSRVRNAMQYADTLDDFVELMEKSNNGGYANSWLLGDVNTGEIVRFELGLEYQSVERTKDGYFVGFNAANDPRIRNLETSGSGYYDVRMPSGARRVRLTQLMEQHDGEIDLQLAQDILADHYDVYLEKENPGSRTVEGHYELDAFEYWPARLPYAPKGTVDGKVMDSSLASQLAFWARWGSSSGMAFNAEEHIRSHPQWDHLRGYLKDRPSQPWTLFSAGDQPSAVGTGNRQGQADQETKLAHTAEEPAESGETTALGATLGGREDASSAQGLASGRITARMLVEPDALMGPGPSHLSWSPRGATLSYVAPGDESEDQVLWLYDAATGTRTALLDPATTGAELDVSTAQWSPDGTSMLVAGDSGLWLLDTGSGELRQIARAAGRTALLFSPSGEDVSFVRDNDLYVLSTADGQVQQLTFDGDDNVYNGVLDWVYNEEMATRAAQPAYAWSPDGSWLVSLRLDDSDVSSHPILDYRPIPTSVQTIRYPTAGTNNPDASLRIIGFSDGKAEKPTQIPEHAEYVLPLLSWSPDSAEALYLTVSRDHKTLRLRAWNPTTGEGRTVIEESDPHWINEHLYAPPVFVSGGRQFLWISERSGFMHLYLYNLDGTLVRQVTEGDWLIDSAAWDIMTPGRPVHVDPAGTWAYFSSTAKGPLERHLYRTNIASGEMQQLSRRPGFHSSMLSANGKYLVDRFSNIDTPPVTTVLNADGSTVEVLGENAGPSLALPKVSREFVTIEAHDGTVLYGQMVKPEDFDPEKRYGVVVHWYGGPTLQLVSNRYGADYIFNHIERDVLYTQAGLIVWRLDNRGSFGRGHAFETPIAGELGPAALDDQIAGVEYLKTLPYVDPSRVCTDGKSFGGFLTLLALTHAPDVFACGVAGSGPTDWLTYDTIYTERYMGLPDENKKGYTASNIVDQVGEFRVPPLLIHGLADTNVHLQNTVNLMEAMIAEDKPFEFVPLPNSDHHYGGDGLVVVLSESVRYVSENIGEESR
jgi:dipeptidyl aminopeptidase/acylaminoacyl peptidase